MWQQSLKKEFKMVTLIQHINNQLITKRRGKIHVPKKMNMHGQQISTSTYLE